jgi:predicted transcriptional regulator
MATYDPGMSRRFSVWVSDELARRVDARADTLGKTRSEVIRDALTRAEAMAGPDPAPLPELLRRAAALRRNLLETTDAAALVRELRGGAALRLPLMRLTVPFA